MYYRYVCAMYKDQYADTRGIIDTPTHEGFGRRKQGPAFSSGASWLLLPMGYILRICIYIHIHTDIYIYIHKKKYGFDSSSR